MATISALPNELLIEIWRHVLQPADIESFALASKKIHAVSAPFLLEHRDLRYKFTNFYNGSLWSGRSKKSVAGLLKEITINHNVALYVTSLTITSWRDRWDCPEEANLWSRPLRPDSVFRPNIPKLVAFVSVAEESERACPNAHLPYRENDMMILEHAAKRAARVFGNVESLIEGIRGGKEDPIIALLLLQLSVRTFRSRFPLFGIKFVTRYVAGGRGGISTSWSQFCDSSSSFE